MMKTKNQLFYCDLFNSNSVEIFCSYYESQRDVKIVRLMKIGQTQNRISQNLKMSQPSLSRAINRIINHYTKFCKCIGEITADRLKGEQND